MSEALSEGHGCRRHREAEDMKALFEEEPVKKRSRGGRLVCCPFLLLAGTVVAGFISPDVGRQFGPITRDGWC